MFSLAHLNLSDINPHHPQAPKFCTTHFAPAKLASLCSSRRPFRDFILALLSLPGTLFAQIIFVVPSFPSGFCSNLSLSETLSLTFLVKTAPLLPLPITLYSPSLIYFCFCSILCTCLLFSFQNVSSLRKGLFVHCLISMLEQCLAHSRFLVNA